MIQKKISLVLIHGWGSDNRSWEPLLPYLENFAEIQLIELPGFGDSPSVNTFDLQSVLVFISARIASRSWVLGWSLGGMLAVQLAKHFPQKVEGLITLAANAKFVAGNDYAVAMPPATNKEFNQSFLDNPTAALKVFAGLVVRGALDERSLLKKIRPSFLFESVKSDVWYSALMLLSELDNREVLATSHQPCLHLLADGDCLVPGEAAQMLGVINSRHKVKLFANAAHAIHWCYPQEVANEINQFIQEITRQNIFKKKVAHNFSRASKGYDQLSSVQFDAGQKLLHDFTSSLDLPEQSLIMDLGAGTGKMLRPLQRKFPVSSIMALDLSVAMLRQAKISQDQLHGVDKTPIYYVTSDAENLPSANASVDLIYSNFSLQWCKNISAVVNEMARCLKSHGEVLLTTLVDKTLHELRQAWQVVDQKSHVNQFVVCQDFLDQLSVKFELVALEKKSMVAEFDRIEDLLQSLKGIGATYTATGNESAVGLTGRKAFEKLTIAYENFRQNGKLPLTYDVLFVRAKKRE